MDTQRRETLFVVCKDCGQSFPFTPGEQQFYRDKMLPSPEIEDDELDDFFRAFAGSSPALLTGSGGRYRLPTVRASGGARAGFAGRPGRVSK